MNQKKDFILIIIWFLFFIFIALYISFLWFKDIIDEKLISGYHTKIVQFNLRIGMILFIFSEVMFFFSFFFGLFYLSLTPSIAIGSEWPPDLIKIPTPGV